MDSQSPTSGPSLDQACDQRREDVLHLDENLNLLAIQETSSLLGQILQIARSHGTLQTLGLMCQVRLTYVLLRADQPRLDRKEILALHRHCQKALADSLTRSRSLLHNRTS